MYMHMTSHATCHVCSYQCAPPHLMLFTPTLAHSPQWEKSASDSDSYLRLPETTIFLISIRLLWLVWADQRPYPFVLSCNVERAQLSIQMQYCPYNNMTLAQRNTWHDIVYTCSCTCSCTVSHNKTDNMRLYRSLHVLGTRAVVLRHDTTLSCTLCCISLLTTPLVPQNA